MISNRIAIFTLLFLRLPFLNANTFTLVDPDEVGTSFVGSRQDASQIQSEDAFGPGVQFYLKYNINPNFFMTIGTGITTITDRFLSQDNFKAILVPQIELNLGHHLFTHKRFTPFLYTGFQAYRFLVQGQTNEPAFDICMIFGGGYRYILKESRIAFYMSGDYRYVFTSSDIPRPQYWVGKAGLSFSLNESFFPDRERPFQNPESDQDQLLALGVREQSGLTYTSEKRNTNRTTPDRKRKSYKVQNISTNMQTLLSQIRYLEQKNQLLERQLTDLRNKKAIAGKTRTEKTISRTSVSDQYFTAMQKIERGNFSAAIEDLMSILGSVRESDPMKSKCKYWIGSCYASLGDYRSALQYYVDVLKKNRDSNAAGAGKPVLDQRHRLSGHQNLTLLTTEAH